MKSFKFKALFFLLLFAGTNLFAQEKIYTGDSPLTKIDMKRLPASLALEVRLRDTNGNNAIDAEEKGTLEVTVKNAGPGKAYALKLNAVITKKIKGLQFSQTPQAFPVLMPGSAKTARFTWSATQYISDTRCSIRISVEEKFNNAPAPKEISIETRALVPPDLQVTDIGIDDDDQGDSYGNGNGKIEKGESIEVEAIVQNRGQGEAGEVKVQVQCDDPNLFFVSKRRFALGDLPAGEYRKIKFAFTVPPNYGGAARLPLSLKISESRGRYGKKAALALTLDQSMKRTTEIAAERIAIAAKERRRIEITEAPSLTVDVDVNILQTKTRRSNGIAVIIGNRDYSGVDVPNVDYAIRDASVMKDYLIRTLGYREGNIIYLENATKAQFEATFGTATDYRGRLFGFVKRGKSEVFIYYSGHGAPDPESKQGYFVPADCDPTLVRLNGYSLQTFYDNLAKLHAKRLTVVIDACFSGISQGGALLRQVSPVRIRIENPLLALPSATVLTSASGDQVSSWWAEKRHSLFTYFLLKGLGGAADANRDRKITMQELFDYVSDPTDGVPYWAQRLHNREQTPTVVGKVGDGVLFRY